LNITANHQWHDSHTDLSKYLLARLMQMVDTTEVITNRQRTTNGLILLEEVYSTATLCLNQWKNHYRLRALLLECIDPDVGTSIMNDLIFSEYFRNIRDDAQRWKERSEQDLTLDVAKEVQTVALMHISALKLEYVERLRDEFEKLDLHSLHFDTLSRRIDQLLLLLIPQLLYDGHSIGFLQIAPQSLRNRPLHELIEGMFRHFSFGDDRSYNFWTTGEDLHSSLVNRLTAERMELQKRNFVRQVPASTVGYAFTASGKDPYSALRNIVTEAFRGMSLRSSDADPNVLEPIWNGSYYFNDARNKYSEVNFRSNSDPIVPAVRADTLGLTLDRLCESVDEIPDRVLRQVEEPLYFYNLARNVPSVENSYILLWTALESLMGLRTEKADIEIVKDNLSEAMGVGAVGRRVNSTVQRIRTLGQANSWPYLGPPNADEYDRAGLSRWLEWFVNQSVANTTDDPFTVLKDDPLVCKQYRQMNENWRTLGDLRTLILMTEKNLRYQIDRLYLTRNRIVHSGQFGRTGIYLWVHLEWYVGKILGQAILTIQETFEQLQADPRDVVFGCLRGQYKSTVDYLNRHSQKEIAFEHLMASGVTRFPVFCF
jgi:hypothetical protein